MNQKRFVLFLVLCVCFLPALAQENQLATLSLSIRQNLLDLREQSHELTTQLESLQTELTQSQIEVEKLQTHSNKLSISLTAINQKLNDCYKIIEEQKAELQTKKKIVEMLFFVLALMILLKIVCYILAFRGLVLPRWLDILL